MATETVGTYKIFVGNIPPGTTSDELRKIFEEFGTVVECDCFGVRGFVHMEDDIEGRHAVGELQGRTLKGQTLTIEESKKKGFARIPAVKLFVKNVNSTVDARGVRNMFKRFGYVLEVQLMEGEGHVLLEATGDIRSAIKEMNGHVIDEVAMEVEPGPVVPPPEIAPSAKKMKPTNYRGRNDWDNSWSSAGPSAYHQPEESYYEDEQAYYDHDYDNDNAYNNPGPNPFEHNPFDNPFEFPHPPPYHQPSFDPPPERILRDPHAHMVRNGGFGRSRGGHGPRFRGRGRGQPSFMTPPEPPPRRLMLPGRPGHPRGMRGMGIGFGMPRGGGAPHQIYDQSPEERIPRDRFAIQAPQNEYDIDEANEVFYEDEPLSAPFSQVRRRSLSGSNMVPIGGGETEEFVSRTPGPRRSNFTRGGNAGRRGRGRGRPERFTAMTEEIAPGEKYPVPPMQNPSFRAPQKWPKEEVKRKVKRKKKPLVPAELPDYSTPVPDLPNQSVPRGAVLKAFPPPMSQRLTPGISQVEFSLSNGAGPSRSNSQIDFTSDDAV